MAEDGEKPALVWWGRFALAIGERGLWRVGPMRLSVARGRQEWSIDYRKNAEPRDARDFECPSSSTLDGPSAARSRYAFSEAPATFWIRPVLADRAVVVYPEDRFHVTPGESITLYCSTPLWIRVEVGEARLPLLETAIERPPETWIGPSTREGELCYATQTTARLDRGSVPRHPHRAVTELRIRNGASDTLELPRVNLAVPYLSLYASPDGGLWTESVALERTTSATMGRLEIGHPPFPSAVERITPPRLRSEPGGILVRAFSALFD
jgi:hypothetical protein